MAETSADNGSVLCAVDGDGVACVTMARPPVNAMDAGLRDRIIAVFDELSDRADVRAVVLTGQGKCFCAGADLKERQDRTGAAGEAWHHNRQVRECFHSIVECTKPVIAAINGPALGAGLALAASCDILIAAETAQLGLPEIDVGLMGGARHAQRLFGHSRLRRMLLTGMRMPGAELYRLGVVEACVPPDALMDETMDLAREIAGKSPAAVRYAKHALNSIEEMGLRDGYRFEQNLTVALSDHPDSREARQAFLEKRKPNFGSQ